jgi:hypothetical protein
MWWIGGGRSGLGMRGVGNQMGHFETRWLTGKRTFRQPPICPVSQSTTFMTAVRLRPLFSQPVIATQPKVAGLETITVLCRPPLPDWRNAA